MLSKNQNLIWRTTQKGDRGMIERFIEEIRLRTGGAPSLEEIMPGEWIAFPLSGKRGDTKGLSGRLSLACALLLIPLAAIADSLNVQVHKFQFTYISIRRLFFSPCLSR